MNNYTPYESEWMGKHTYYHTDTPQAVKDKLEFYLKSGHRIRLFYGDAVTGRDWMEEYDTMGTVSRSTGDKPIPILIHNSRSMGGGGIMDHCIVKITLNKKTVYQHPTYYIPISKAIPSNRPDLPWQVRREDDNSIQAMFKTQQKACNYLNFMYGDRDKQ